MNCYSHQKSWEEVLQVASKAVEVIDKTNERQYWRKALNNFDEILHHPSLSGKFTPVLMFHKATCLFFLGMWSETEPIIEDGLLVCDQSKERITKDRLSELLSKLRLTLNNFNNGQRFMQQEAWREGLNHFELVLDKAPFCLPAIAAKASCLFWLNDLTEAKRAANSGIQMCDSKEDQLIKTQLSQILSDVLLLEQKAARKIDFTEINKTMADKKWLLALNNLRELVGALLSHDDEILVLTNMAKCLLELAEWDEANSMATIALQKCQDNDKQIKKRLQQMLKDIARKRDS